MAGKKDGKSQRHSSKSRDQTQSASKDETGNEKDHLVVLVNGVGGRSERITYLEFSALLLLFGHDHDHDQRGVSSDFIAHVLMS